MTNSRKDPVPNQPPISREALARWLGDRTDMLMRRIRGQVREARSHGLGGPFAASLLDEEDILASVSRRVDEAAARGRLTTADSALLWGYVRGVTGRVIQSRLRAGARDMRLYSRLSTEERQSFEAAQEELDRIAPLIQEVLTPDEWERLLSRARGLGMPAGEITTGESPVSQRKRWSRLIASVRRAVALSPRGAPISPPPRQASR